MLVTLLFVKSLASHFGRVLAFLEPVSPTLNTGSCLSKSQVCVQCPLGWVSVHAERQLLGGLPPEARAAPALPHSPVRSPHLFTSSGHSFLRDGSFRYIIRNRT